MSTVDLEALRAAIGKVEDPEIHRSLADLNMLRELDVDSSGSVKVLVALTIPGCPLKDRLNQDVTAAAMSVSGVTANYLDVVNLADFQAGDGLTPPLLRLIRLRSTVNA